MNKEKYLPSTLKNDENFSVKELAKTLCTCHHKCNDTKDCVVEDEALLLINENKSNNFDVKSNNEIEEMTKTLHEGMKPLKETYGANELASILYHAGYRKQSEGEWIFKLTYYEADECNCSVCGQLMTTAKGVRMNYCPNCGTKMKGGE